MFGFLRKIIPIHKLAFIIHDFALITLTLYLCLKISLPNYYEFSNSFVYSFIFLLIGMIFIFKFSNMYRYQVFLNTPRHIVLLAKSIVLSMTLHIYFAFFMKYPEVTLSRRFVLETYFALFIVLLITRVVIIPRIYFHMVREGKLSVNMLVLGAGTTARAKVAALLSDNANYYKVVGYLDDSAEKQGKVFDGIPVLGDVTKLEETVKKYKVNDIFVYIRNISPEKLQSIIDFCKKIEKPVHIDSSLFDIVKERLSVEEISSTSTFRVVPTKTRNYYDVAKRIIDVTGALIIIIGLLPVWIVLYLSVILSSKGPGFYRARVVGKDCKEFNMLKFRSMYHNTSKKLHEDKVKDMIKKNEATTKLENDPRITPLGRIMRKYSIDEFPQLWNVLIGDMSLVGPRPNVPYEFEHMEDWQKKRFEVLPGMTGLWQIKGRDEVKFTDQIVLDFFYIENRSIMLDLEILLKTIPVVLFGKGGK
ncbi:MAG: sugar transferase [Candidatus Delongbacteria bacterium]|nr:sugar transferase [Candidatus Delongbacteria bacterium]